MAHIPGYTYGTTEVARSPVSLEELEQLKQTMHFADEDHEYLRLAGEGRNIARSGGTGASRMISE